MIENDDVTSIEAQEQNQHLIAHLSRFYHTSPDDAQSLARIRARLLAGERVSQRGSSSDHVIPYYIPLTKSANTPNNLLWRAGWHYRLNTVAAVLVATFLVGSLLVLLKFGHQSSIGTGKRASVSQHVSQLTPTPLPFLTVPKGWILLARLGNTGEMIAGQSFIASHSWQALLSCEGPGKVYAHFALGNAYPSSLEAKYGLPSDISYTFSCNSRAGTQIFPSSPSKVGVLVQASSDNQSKWRMIIIGCLNNSSACKASNT